MLRHLVLDTNVLCDHWQRRSRARQISEVEVRAWAQELIEIEDANAIVTPVVIEVLAGVRSSRELNFTRLFLSAFRVVDERRILEEDWREAERLAARVPRDGNPRDFADCLIQAIATRLHYDVRTHDERFRDHRSNRP